MVVRATSVCVCLRGTLTIKEGEDEREGRLRGQKNNSALQDQQKAHVHYLHATINERSAHSLDLILVRPKTKAATTPTAVPQTTGLPTQLGASATSSASLPK